MELTPKAQAVELIKQSQKILILTHRDPDGDALGSLLALRAALTKLGKEVEAILDGRINPVFSYLAGFQEIQGKRLAASNDLVITIDTRNTGEDLKLGYKKLSSEHRIQIVITPPKGALMPEDVSVERSMPKFDLVIILDTPSYERLGSFYQEFPDLFFEVPTISIDHHVNNAYPGKVNWVDMTATSTAEMLVSLIEAISRGEPLIDEDIATALLTGLITDTGSFQNMSTTPKALTVAAQLVAAGGKHQMIMERVKTKSLTTLKLWGRALSRVQDNSELRYVWTEVLPEDFEVTGAAIGEDGELIDELLKSVTVADFVFTLSQRDQIVKGKLRSVVKDVDVSQLASAFGGGGHKMAASFEIEGNLEDLRGEILTKIETFQRERLAAKQSH